jgi:hypothetical protein
MNCSMYNYNNIVKCKHIIEISTRDIVIPIITIPLIDIFLCKVFGNKSRWFQLHSVINAIVLSIIWNDVLQLFINPLIGIRDIESKIDGYFILILHIYHILILKQLTFMDYFHHFLFVGGGVLPAIVFYNSNLTRIGWFAASGLPGCIEYFCLSLVKHGKMNHILQKKINAYIYNYIRYPITIYCPAITYTAYKYGLLINYNPYILIYVNLILFINGGFYNKLTIENYISHKYKKNHSYNNLQEYHII